MDEESEREGRGERKDGQRKVEGRGEKGKWIKEGREAGEREGDG